jgi:MFS family permease
VSTLVPDSGLSLFLLGLISFLTVGTGGANIAAIQEIIPNRLRGRVTALYFALLSLVGGTIGPLLIGLLNDHLFTDELSIGKSLALISALTVPTGAALVYVAARRRRKLDWIN